MNVARLRSLLVGPDLGFFGTCFLAGLGGALLTGLFLPWVLPAGLIDHALAVFAIPVAVLIGLRNGGLVSAWITIFPSLYVLYDLGACSDHSFCLPPSTGELILAAVQGTLLFGTVGFLFGRAFDRRREKTSSAAALSDFGAVAFGAGVSGYPLSSLVPSNGWVEVGPFAAGLDFWQETLLLASVAAIAIGAVGYLLGKAWTSRTVRAIDT